MWYRQPVFTFTGYLAFLSYNLYSPIAASHFNDKSGVPLHNEYFAVGSIIPMGPSVR